MTKDKEKPLNIYQRMNAVMADVDYIQKEKVVDGKYTCVTHDQVTAKLHPYMVTHGICVTCSVNSYKNESVETQKKDGTIIANTRTEVDLKVRFINIDDPSDFIEVNAIGFGFDPSDKGAGKATSYAFKYAILKNFMLETGDDPDLDQETKLANKKINKIEDPFPPISVEQAVELNSLLLQCDPIQIEFFKNNLKEKYSIEDFRMIPFDSFEKTKKLLLDKIQAWKKSQENATPYAEEKTG